MNAIGCVGGGGVGVCFGFFWGCGSFLVRGGGWVVLGGWGGVFVVVGVGFLGGRGTARFGLFWGGGGGGGWGVLPGRPGERRPGLVLIAAAL